MNPFTTPTMDRNRFVERASRIAIWLCLGLALLSVFLLGTSYSANAQWSTDPAAPMQVCDAAGTPTFVKTLPDAANGWYTFWTDKRTDQTHREIYGQHLDGEGNALWPVNGKLIHAEPGTSIEEIAVATMDDGNLLLAYIHRPAISQDTLSAMVIDANGDAVWPAPVQVAQCGAAFSVSGIGQLRAIPTPGGAYIGWYDNYYGGSSGVNITRITNVGLLPWGMEGYAIPGASYGPFEIHGDDATGVMVQWRTGNGSGAALKTMRVDSSGTNAWPANVPTSAGSGGLNYAFHTAMDNLGAQITAWVDLPHKIVMARMDLTGTLTFSPSPVAVCTFASSQDKPKVVVNDGYTFVAWTDNRPPASNSDLYLQKLDADGNLQWDLDGVPALQLNTYIPTSGLVASDSGAVIATMDGNVVGYSAMRIRADGSFAWSAPVQFCTPAFNPFYAAQSQFADGDGGVVSFWQTNSNAIYTGRIYRTGDLGNHVGITEHPHTSIVNAWPNPAQDRINFQFPSGAVPLSVEVIDGLGSIYSAALQGGSISVGSLAAGAYTARIRTRSAVFLSRFIKQ